MFCLIFKRRILLTAAFAFLYGLVSPQIPLAKSLPENPREISWHISALNVTYDNKRDLYIAEDEVIITGGKTRLEAEYVEFSNKTKTAFARGNVLLISGQDSITCNAMEINLLTEKGSIDKGTIFIQESNFYISGENIQKTGEFTYSADKGTITSCQGETPDWKITGKNIRVTVEGYGHATHATLWAGKVPSLYSPFLTFPVKTKRQTGLLTPRISSSDRKGWEVEQPLFIAISRNMDATLYADAMADRGVKVAGELRYVLDDQSRGVIFLDSLEDDKIDDGTLETKKYSYQSTPQRTNTDRYWFRMKHDQALPHEFTAQLDLDIVSDADYLLEFQDGFTGYDDTNDYFEKTFGRGLDEYNDFTRKNHLTLTRPWSHHLFNAQTLWYDNVISRQKDTPDTTLQTLPSFEFDAARQELGKSGFFYTLDSEFRSFFRQDTTHAPVTARTPDLYRRAFQVSGQRTDIYPKIYLPLNLGKSFFFEPFVGTRATGWHTEDFTDFQGHDDNFKTRATYDAGTQLSTSLNRVFFLDNEFADKIKHEVVPKIEYVFQPHVDQDDLPYFDSLDDLDEKNQVTWSLTNSFIARNTALAPNGENIYGYREFAWIKLYQDYDIETQEQGRESWSDLKLESELSPFSYFSMDADLAWSPYTAHFNEIHVGANLKDKRGDSIHTSYRYTNGVLKTWYSRFYLKLTDSLGTYYSFESDLETQTTIETRAGLLVSKACWGVGVEFQESSDEKKVTFLITLRGIGEFGTQ